jgi:hypothetical protein
MRQRKRKRQPTGPPWIVKSEEASPPQAVGHRGSFTLSGPARCLFLFGLVGGIPAPGSAGGSVTMPVGVVPRGATPRRSRGLESDALGRVVRSVKLAVRTPDDFSRPVYAAAREIAVKTSPFPGQSGLSAVPAGG